MPRKFFRILLLFGVALCLAGCDKCGDYFWLNTATPHSCKEGPVQK
jgi:hypothetical protein